MAARRNKTQIVHPMINGGVPFVKMCHRFPFHQKPTTICVFFYLSLSLSYHYANKSHFKTAKSIKMSHTLYLPRLRLVIRGGNQELVPTGTDYILESIPNCVIPETQLALTISVIDGYALQTVTHNVHSLGGGGGGDTV